MGALFVYLVQSVFGNVMPFTAPLFFILIGIVIKELDFKENDFILICREGFYILPQKQTLSIHQHRLLPFGCI